MQVTDCLTRIAKAPHVGLVKHPPIPAAAQYGHRNKMTFRTVQTAEGPSFGLLGRGSHTVVPVQRCLLQGEAMNGILAQAQARCHASSPVCLVSLHTPVSALATDLCVVPV